MRTHKMSLYEQRRAEKSWEELWQSEKLRQISWDEMRRDEKSSNDMRREENSRDQLRRAEDGREDMRWDEVRCGEKSWEDMRWVEMSWDEMGWHRLRWQWDAVSNFQEKLRCDEIRWNEKRFNIQKTWHQTSDWQVKSLLPRSTGGLPVTYRHRLCSALQAIRVSNLKLPPLACPGTTCTNINLHLGHRQATILLHKNVGVPALQVRWQIGLRHPEGWTHLIPIIRACARHEPGGGAKGWWTSLVMFKEKLMGHQIWNTHLL